MPVPNITMNHISRTNRIKTGSVGGLVGGFSVILVVFAIDSHLGVTHGTFYKIVGLPLGLEGISASLLGLLAHMSTAVLIGSVFCYCSGLHPKLHLTSIKKGMLAGGITSIVVYLVFFIPITFFIVQPALEDGVQNESGLIATLSNMESSNLLQNMNLVVWGSLEIHLVFGIVLGIFCAMSLDEYRKPMQGTKNFFKTIILGIVLGSIALSVYYVVESEYVIQEKQNDLTLQLQQIQKDLTYAKFIDMTEEKQIELVSKMPYQTRDLLVKYAQNFNSQTNEDMSLITQNLASPDQLKYVKTAKIQGLKGNEAHGIAKLLSDGNLQYLRLENFFVTNGIGLHVYITKSDDISSGYDLGSLKANTGDQNYVLPDINTEEYKTVVIYSKPFKTYYASANL